MAPQARRARSVALLRTGRDPGILASAGTLCDHRHRAARARPAAVGNGAAAARAALIGPIAAGMVAAPAGSTAAEFPESLPIAAAVGTAGSTVEAATGSIVASGCIEVAWADSTPGREPVRRRHGRRAPYDHCGCGARCRGLPGEQSLRRSRRPGHGRWGPALSDYCPESCRGMPAAGTRETSRGMYRGRI